MSRRTKPKLEGGLFASVGEAEKPSPLSLVPSETESNVQTFPGPKPGDRKRAIGRPHRTVVDQNRASAAQFGRPDDQKAGGVGDQNLELRDNPEWASRVARRRKGGRFNPELLKKTEVELKKQGADWQDFVDQAMRFWLEMGAPSLVKWSPALLWCCSCGSKEVDLKTTTTTTVVAQTLPGFPSELLEMPNKSRHSSDVLWRYAQSSYNSEISGFEGLKKPPLFWVRANMKTGRDDSLVDAWLEAKRRIEDETARRLAARDEREASDAIRTAALKREFEERQRKDESRDAKRKREE